MLAENCNTPTEKCSSSHGPLKPPSDVEVVAAVQALRLQTPDLGRAKVLSRLKEEKQWTLSDLRLKKLMAKHGLGLSTAKEAVTKAEESPIAYPKDALAAQRRYKIESTRCFKLYGRGPYDFGVTPNSDQAIRIDVRPTIMMLTWPEK